MILICGIPKEAPTRMVIQAASKMGLPYLVLNQRQLTEAQMKYRLDPHGSLHRLVGELTLDGETHDLNDFTGVFNRMMDVHSLPAVNSPIENKKLEDNKNQQKIRRIHQVFQDWLELTQSSVMNRNSAMASNLSKPYQAQLIRSCGFRIPDTLITNVPEVVKQFIQRHQRVIYKSISAERSIVMEIEPSGINQLEKIRNLPTQFQAFIPGLDYRVHVVGEKLYACQIRTEAVDYRYANLQDLDLQINPVQLDNSIEQTCHALAKLLNLPLCGIDLKCTPDGIWYCFEVNPMPAFSYYEEQTDQPIARTIVEYLDHRSD